MKTKLLYGALLTTLLSLCALTGCGKRSGEDKYDKKGRLILEISNVYFGGSSEEGIRPYDGADTYTEIINDKFGVKITPSSPSYGTWEDDVNIAVSGRSMTDVIHYNVKAYNFGVYEQWVKKGFATLEGGILKLVGRGWIFMDSVVTDVLNACR